MFRGGRYFYGGHLFAGLGAIALANDEDTRLRDTTSVWQSLPIDLYGDFGLRIDSYVGIFNFSVANFRGRLPL